MNCSKQRHDGGSYRQYKTMVAAPLTDEAVQMVMERLEALKDGKSD